MERRVLLAISLSFVVLFAYQQFVAPPQPAQSARNATATTTTQTGLAAGRGVPDGLEAGAASGARTLTAGNGTTAAPILPPTPAPPIVGDTEEREFVIDTQKVRAVFTNRGARLTHWVLKDYKNDQGDPLDLVPESIPPPLPRPFSLRVDDATVTATLNDALYKASGVSGTTVDATVENATVTFELETANGIRARKIFVFDPASFIVSVSVNVMQGAQTLNPFIEWGPGLGDAIARTQAGSFLSPNYMYKAQAIYYTDGDVEREAVTGLGSGVVHEGVFRWAGVDDHYFISAVLQPASPTRLEFVPIAIPTTTSPPLVGDYVAWAIRFPNPPESARFYIGPKQLDVMRGIDPEFTRAIYFGMFAWLAAPLLDALRWVHNYVADWGWSIVVLTILINLAMFPLRHKSVVSMRRMQELQPQLKAIQDRYAKYKITDPERQKMNSEVMELYKSRGVNPASGCVPMLLTMPFLFAFYAMLGQAIEIRGESFFWIRDLSTADPLYITPVLMGVTMFWQQKITPTTADPTQQKIMMFMPVMITVTMLFAPAGLVIYWLVSNVWSIGQQYLTNQLIGPARVPGAGGSKPAKDAKAPKDIVVAKSLEPQGIEAATPEKGNTKHTKRTKTKS